ncbi:MULTISPECIES: Arc family DNA-binding protein [Acinetobacter calcoaceticus/baumannii complex]|uniref:Arc-like DNA binding domain-containing protein n=1 Tax=Acinetobacter pittii ANC 4050 TaxID=1217691 RepID=R8YHD8_ACIPI|nr:MULTISPECIES: Arc family DNA-binding protein [Acinetobacter calcoaceticus/baumannii complex]EOQ68835.1 hypothetical protein F931_01553 [Acinetobacter pittii ANC 4050]RSO39157.1 Arc family DNA-binding protein [Acinetobacter lactucae]
MNAVQLNTRMPEEIKAFLIEQAKKEGRSLNNYLVRHFEELKVKSTDNKKAQHLQATGLIDVNNQEVS